MNKMFKKNLCVVLSVLLMFSFNLVAFAQGSTSIAVSESAVGVGDSTTVSITASSSGTITVKYTASLMSLSDCTATGYKSEGNTVTFSGTSGDLVFEAIGEGMASVIVSSSSCSGSSTTINISGAGTGGAESSSESSEASEASEPAEASEPVTQTSAGVGTLNADGGFDIDGVSYVVSERFSDGEIPSGFSKVSLNIGAGTYNELSNGTLTIIYLKAADKIDGSGEFYLYNAEAATVTKFKKLGSSSNYVIIGAADYIPAAFTATTLSVASGDYDAYTAGEGSEFYYVYGTNNAGLEGWYVCDSADESIFKADEALLYSAAVSNGSDVTEVDEVSYYDPTEVYKVKLKKLRRIISVLVVICVLMAFFIINFVVKKKIDDSEIDEDDEDENEKGHESSDDIFAQPPTKHAKRMPRSIVFKDEDEEDDIEEDDDEDELPRRNNGTGSASAKNAGLNMMDLNDL